MPDVEHSDGAMEIGRCRRIAESIRPWADAMERQMQAARRRRFGENRRDPRGGETRFVHQFVESEV